MAADNLKRFFMPPQIFNLSFITSCFCAGANPAVAEVRAPSIRGKLRWWFRVLGGTPEQEAKVFGSIAGDQGKASALTVRVADLAVERQWQPINFSPNSNTGYLLYFAKESQNQARWKPGGAIPPGGSFELQISWRRPVPDDARKTFDLALEAFLLLGALGLRSSRGLGCFETQERLFTEVAFKSIVNAIKTKAPKFLAELGVFRGTEVQLLDALGGQLRGLRKGCSAGTPRQSKSTPLGSSQPRQASAVYLRPVKVAPQDFQIVVFEAPADMVLGEPSRNGAPRLRGGVPSPADPPQRNRSYGGYR